MPTVRLSFTLPLVVLLSIAVLGCENTSPETVIARAEQSMLKNDYQAALIDLKAVLQRDPQNVRARWLLAEVYLAVEDGPSAEKELTRASRLGVLNDSVLPAMANALYLQQKFDDVLAIEPEVGMSATSAAEISAFKTLAHLGKRELDEAKRQIVVAQGQASASNWVRLAQASVLAAEQQLDAALEQATRLTQDLPNFPNGWRLLGNVRGAKKDIPGAEQAYSKAIALRPLDMDSRSRRAVTRIFQQKWDQVMLDARALQKIAPQNHLGHYLAGRVAYERNKLEEAQEHLARAVEFSDRDYASVFLLASVEAQLGDSVRGRQMAEQALAIAPDSIDARKLMSLWYLRDKKYRDVERLMAPVVLARPDDLDAKRTLATALLSLGRAEEAEALFDAVSLARPDSATAHLSAGVASIAAGNSEQALNALRRVERMTPTDQRVNEVLIAGFLKENATAEALDAAQRFADQTPNNTAALNTLAAAQMASGETAPAYETYRKVLVIDPGNAKANRAFALRAAGERDYATAAAHLDTGLNSNPGDLQLLLMRAELAKLSGDPALKVTLLDTAIEQHPEAVEPRAQRAKLLLEQDRAEDALALLRGYADSQHVGALATRAEANYRLGLYDDAQQDLEALAKLQPDSVAVQWQLVRVFAASSEKHKLAQRLRRLAEMQPDNAYVKLARARLAALDGNAEAAQRLIAQTGLSEDDPDLLYTRIMLAQQQDDRLAEIASRAKLLSVQPTTEHVIALSRAYSSEKMTDDAERVLADWLKQNADDTFPRLRLANLKAARGDIDGAVIQYRRLLDIDPDNTFATNNLAWYLRESAPAEALGLARRAHSKAPNSVVTLDTYAMVLAENRQFDEAMQRINEAIDRARDKAQFIVHRAQIRRMAGDDERAARDLRSVLDGYPSDDIRQQAEQALLELGSG